MVRVDRYGATTFFPGLCLSVLCQSNLLGPSNPQTWRAAHCEQETSLLDWCRACSPVSFPAGIQLPYGTSTGPHDTEPEDRAARSSRAMVGVWVGSGIYCGHSFPVGWQVAGRV